MNGLTRIILFLITASCVVAQNPAPSPEGTNAPVDPAAHAPKLREQVDLTQTPSAEAMEFPQPPGAADPSKTKEVTAPLPGDEPAPERPPVTGTVQVTAKSNGQTVPATVGNLVRITLESNPSTGFNWELRDFEFGAADFYSSDVVPRKTGNVLFGAPADTVITLQAVKPGSQEIKLVYRRPWEPPDQFAATFVFKLEVTPPPAP